MRTERLLNEWLTAWLQRVETRDEATERVTEIFDTTQSPDSTTGTPPLSARIRERHEARSRSDSQAKVEAAKRQHRHGVRGSLNRTPPRPRRREAETSGESEAESREEKAATKPSCGCP